MLNACVFVYIRLWRLFVYIYLFLTFEKLAENHFWGKIFCKTKLLNKNQSFLSINKENIGHSDWKEVLKCVNKWRKCKKFRYINKNIFILANNPLKSEKKKTIQNNLIYENVAITPMTIQFKPFSTTFNLNSAFNLKRGQLST